MKQLVTVSEVGMNKSAGSEADHRVLFSGAVAN